MAVQAGGRPRPRLLLLLLLMTNSFKAVRAACCAAGCWLDPG
jgi:hypothetical protein